MVRSRATLLDRIIRQCRRSTVTVTELHRNMRSILQTCLQNCFNTLEGETTISVAQAAKEANVSARAVAHTKLFLSTGKIVQNSRRGGKRKGRSLLDCEVFKERASLWLKTQTALYTARRLRANRKSKKFKSQANVPMESKVSHKVYVVCVGWCMTVCACHLFHVYSLLYRSLRPSFKRLSKTSYSVNITRRVQSGREQNEPQLLMV